MVTTLKTQQKQLILKRLIEINLQEKKPISLYIGKDLNKYNWVELLGILMEKDKNLYLELSNYHNI